MSQNSLPSLSHTTHTPNPTAHVFQTTDCIDEGDDEDEANSGGEHHRSKKSPDKDSIDITHRIHKEFDFNEFYDLAMKVLNGDSASLESLNSLKDRWQEKLQSTVEESRAAKLKPVVGRVDTPHPARVSLLPRRKVLGVPTPTITLMPLDDGQATPNLTEEGETGDLQVQDQAAMEEIIEEGPWLFHGQPIVIQCWEQGMSLWRQKLTQIPVWVRLKHLPMEYWTDDGLGTVASGVGIPLYTDKITKNCSRIDYAWVCVMLDYNSTLPKHLIVMNPLMQEGHEVPVKIDIEYEWLPQRCKTCCSLGHTARTCPDNKKSEHIQPVQVFVKKQLASVTGEKTELQADMQRAEADPEVLTAPNKKLAAPLQRAAGDTSPRPVSNKGKSIVLFNPFDILDADCPVHELAKTPATEHTSLGPNISNPDLAGT
ncbi:hypothetical protein Sango_0018100 [Sesamum angolense]|uniref:DUF4283 domain-containing protein n=1 Tax=Sesamum angolense TaxID=2727404 RepID=A0AAE1XCK0_9LAMI|nr:hypothetical protein Sango_0018100 [Sesamum angolense]